MRVWPLEVGLQDLASNHHELLWSKAMVVSVVGKGTLKCQVRFKKMNESEQPMTCRKANQLTSKPNSVVDSGQIQTAPGYGLGGVRCRGCMILFQALVWNVGTCWFNAKERGDSLTRNSASTNVNQRGGAIRSSDEAAVMVVERRGCIIQSRLTINQRLGGVVKLVKVI